MTPAAEVAKTMADALGLDPGSRRAGFSAGKAGAPREVCPGCYDRLSWLAGYTAGWESRRYTVTREQRS